MLLTGHLHWLYLHLAASQTTNDLHKHALCYYPHTSISSSFLLVLQRLFFQIFPILLPVTQVSDQLLTPQRGTHQLIISFPFYILASSHTLTHTFVMALINTQYSCIPYLFIHLFV